MIRWYRVLWAVLVLTSCGVDPINNDQDGSGWSTREGSFECLSDECGEAVSCLSTSIREDVFRVQNHCERSLFFNPNSFCALPTIWSVAGPSPPLDGVFVTMDLELFDCREDVREFEANRLIEVPVPEGVFLCFDGGRVNGAAFESEFDLKLVLPQPYFEAPSGEYRTPTSLCANLEQYQQLHSNIGAIQSKSHLRVSYE